MANSVYAPTEEQIEAFVANLKKSLLDNLRIGSAIRLETKTFTRPIYATEQTRLMGLPDDAVCTGHRVTIDIGEPALAKRDLAVTRREQQCLREPWADDGDFQT